jgi:hypothetical protein
VSVVLLSLVAELVSNRGNGINEWTHSSRYRYKSLIAALMTS